MKTKSILLVTIITGLSFQVQAQVDTSRKKDRKDKTDTAWRQQKRDTSWNKKDTMQRRDTNYIIQNDINKFPATGGFGLNAMINDNKVVFANLQPVNDRIITRYYKPVQNSNFIGKLKDQKKWNLFAAQSKSRYLTNTN